MVRVKQLWTRFFCAKPTWFSSASISHRGGRAYNEDKVGQVALPEGFMAWGIADGLGGHGGGDVAADTALSTALAYLKKNHCLSHEVLFGAFDRAHKAVLDRQHFQPELACMRSTLVLLMSDGRSVMWGHIGDSRCYFFSHNTLTQQTEDHSVPQMLANAGDISLMDIRTHEDRNRLLRTLGNEEKELRPTLLKKTVYLQAGDAILLCTDGFWSYVLEHEMEEDLITAENAEEWLELMQKRLYKIAPDGHDNYSALAVFCQ